MAANVGLSTPRGSGTSGYVQRNLSLLKNTARERGAPYPSDTRDMRTYRQRQPDPDILEHERKRRIENQVFELRDKLEEEGVDEDEIEKQADALRQKLQAQDEGKTTAERSRDKSARDLKSHQVHDLAQAKIVETEKLRRALGIKNDYEEGSHWKKQDDKSHGPAQSDSADRYIDEDAPARPKARAEEGHSSDDGRRRRRRYEDSSDDDDASTSSRNYSD